MIPIPMSLARACAQEQTRTEWLRRLPDAIQELTKRWTLHLESPLDGPEGSCSWVAPAIYQGKVSAILKMGMPHMEAEHEIAGLRFWAGDPTVNLLEADESLNAMLLERCEPGIPLRELPETGQDAAIAALLRRLWRVPPQPHPFRSLAEMTAYWAEETRQNEEKWPDSGLVREGLSLFEELPRSASDSVLLATDLHAGNVLRAQRERWLVIDPKPFLGDPAYDATQHLFNCEARMLADPLGTIQRFSDLLGVDAERVRLWTLARAAAEDRDEWTEKSLTLARRLAL